MNTLLSLLAMLNATQNALEGHETNNAGITQLLKESDAVVMGGCAYDCCADVCGPLHEKYTRCSSYIARVGPEKLKEFAWFNIANIYAANSASMAFFDKSATFTVDANECAWADEVHAALNMTLKETNSFLHAAVMYTRNAKAPDAVAKACFAPNTPPRNFQARHVKRAAQTRDRVLKARMRYIRQDVEALLAAYKFTLAPVGGSGYTN